MRFASTYAIQVICNEYVTFFPVPPRFAPGHSRFSRRRDAETVRAYASTKPLLPPGGPSGSRVGITNSRPSTGHNYQRPPGLPYQGEEGIEREEEDENSAMELKRQLASAKQDLHFSKVSLPSQGVDIIGSWLNQFMIPVILTVDP